jgi:hypothetical protein
MYKKVQGLKQLELLELPVPRYQIIAIDEDKPSDIEEYVRRKIKLVEVPIQEGDSIGVTIRVSLPTELDKEAVHGGLHNIDENKILQKVLEKYKEYGPRTKIILQYTIDAKCSGNILMENNKIIIEAIPGDAPPLHRGETTDTEIWEYYPDENKWNKKRSFTKKTLLSFQDLKNLVRYSQRISGNAYLEWSISKNGKVYFYELREQP